MDDVRCEIKSRSPAHLENTIDHEARDDATSTPAEVQLVFYSHTGIEKLC